MNLFEFRQWLESLLPWYAPFVIPVLGIIIVAIRWFTSRKFP